MFDKLRNLFGGGSPAERSSPAPRYAYHSPYRDEASNKLYNMLFCDNPALFRPDNGQSPARWQAILYAPSPSAEAIAALAADQSQESRIRALACNYLKRNGKPVPGRELLGTVLEVGLEQGTDALAVFTDGGIRYFNHQVGTAIVVEGRDGLPAANGLVDGVLDASRQIIQRIGPWDALRLPPPRTGNMRMTFLVTDGLYFGEGPMDALEKDPMAAPVVQIGTQLLIMVTESAKS